MNLPDSHDGPGRRFATGSNRSDHLLGAFGFLSHAVLFFGLGVAFTLLCRSYGADTLSLSAAVACATLSLAAVAVRGSQVGLSTTRDSVAAVREAWRRR